MDKTNHTDFGGIVSKIVSPFDGNALNSSSIDLRLGNEAYKYNLSSPYVLGEDIQDNIQEVSGFTEYTVEKGKTAFIGIKERLEMPSSMSGLIVPRSSVTRLGISISTIYVQPGYSGILPLTITNNSGVDVILRPGIRIAQLILQKVSFESESYDMQSDAKYIGENVSPSKLQYDADIEALNKAVKKLFPFAVKD